MIFEWNISPGLDDGAIEKAISRLQRDMHLAAARDFLRMQTPSEHQARISERIFNDIIEKESGGK